MTGWQWQRRWTAWGVAALVGLGVGILARAPKTPTGNLSFRVAAPLETREIDDSSTYWARGGFVQMTGPVRPPTSADRQAHVVVYLKLPDDAFVHLNIKDALEYPPGTIADRVEYYAPADRDDAPAPSWLAADVRGTEIASAGSETFHVLRPRTSRGGGGLVGLAWKDGDPAAQRDATLAVGRLVDEGFALGPERVDARHEAAAHLQSLNACAACHVPSRPPRLRMSEPGIVNRGADASGFFQVSTVLADRAPIETYRPVNGNAGDRFLRFVCGASGSPADVSDTEEAKVSCASGDVPIGVFDLPAALRAGDRHARSLCTSRRYLYAHLDEPARLRFASAAKECEIISEP